MRSFRVILHPDGRVEWVGVDTGKSRLVALNEEARLVAFKVSGHNTWVSGFNPRHYVPAHYEVHRFKSLHDKEGGRRELELEELFGELEWPARGAGL